MLNGVSTFFTTTTAPPRQLWNNLSWEDDLIMTGVRSFDVKAYDNALAGYGDLGWGDDLRCMSRYQNAQGYISPGQRRPTLPGRLPASPPLTVTTWPPVNSGGIPYSTINQTFAHEGRMPPLIEDNRLDAQYPQPHLY